jgi:threonylcarbamoyladenosine tRNA methylthiotransferase MtaB
MPTFSIQNFGCRVNQAEAFAWAETLREGGLRLEPDWAKSDLLLVNSCSLTSRAERDVRKFIQRVGRENPGARLVVTGCTAQHIREEIGRHPQVLFVLANSEKEGLAERVLSLVGRPAPREKRSGVTADESEASFRSRALLKVQDGCDNACAFCIIPCLRGRSVSVAPGEVAVSARRLVDQGYREIVLAGIHLSSYGADLVPKESLLELLRRIEEVRGLGRLRLSSLDPRRTGEALIDHIAANPKVCQHFHLSLQHASPRILEKMGRPDEPELYGSRLSALRQKSPEAALGADIIVGFPEETGEDFALLEDFLEKSPLTYLHVFSYSPRPGTRAAERPRVPDRVIKERSRALRRLSAEKNGRFRRSFAGKVLEGVVVRREGEGAEVVTENYLKVHVPRCPAPKREIVRVRITCVSPDFMEGEVLRP